MSAPRRHGSVVGFQTENPPARKGRIKRDVAALSIHADRCAGTINGSVAGQSKGGVPACRDLIRTETAVSLKWIGR